MRVPDAVPVRHHHIRDGRGLPDDFRDGLDGQGRRLGVEGADDRWQPGHAFGDADQAALVGIAQLVLLHPDRDRPHSREDSQDNAKLQRDQLEAEGDPVNHLTSFPSRVAASGRNRRCSRDQYDHYYLYVRILFAAGGRS